MASIIDEGTSSAARRFGCVLTLLRLVATALLSLRERERKGTGRTFAAAAVQASTRHRLTWLCAAVDATDVLGAHHDR
jgi:hypothetical protein